MPSAIAQPTGHGDVSHALVLDSHDSIEVSNLKVSRAGRYLAATGRGREKMNLTVPNLLVANIGRLAFSSVILLILSACVPIPWFPENPYSEESKSFLSGSNVTRIDVDSQFGQPWANLGVSTFVYVASKASAYILIYGGSDLPVNRDYFLVVDFDDDGFVSKFETFADSLRHNHCFGNGICLESKTFNIPLAPSSLDAKAKQFVPEPDKCVVYIYRDREGIGMAENGYANILFRDSSSYSRFRRLATSVEYGYSRMEFTPSKILEIRIEMQSPKHGGLDDLSDNDPDGEWKEPVNNKLTCNAGTLNYFRLYVPEKNDRKIEFHTVEPEVAQHQIRGIKLLLDRRQFSVEELRDGRLVQ
jgi:hypothetical protein